MTTQVPDSTEVARSTSLQGHARPRKRYGALAASQRRLEAAQGQISALERRGVSLEREVAQLKQTVAQARHAAFQRDPTPPSDRMALADVFNAAVARGERQRDALLSLFLAEHAEPANFERFGRPACDMPPVDVRAGNVSNGSLATFSDVAGALDMPAPNDARLAQFKFSVRHLKPGEVLLRAGTEFESIYIVSAGFLKTVRFDGSGQEQVVAFPMAGDVVGVDSFGLERNATDVVALATSAVIVVPFGRFAHLAHQHPAVERLMLGLFSREMAFKQWLIWLLGTLDAAARVATFLLDLSDRFGRLGYSRRSFLLRMTRRDLGSYLSLQLETVSRAISALAADGVLDVDRRAITVRDFAALRAVADATGDSARRLPPHDGWQGQALGSSPDVARSRARV